MSHAIEEADLIAPERLAECVIDSELIESHRPLDQQRRPLTYRERLQAIEHEIKIILIAGENVAAGFELSRADLDRVSVAVDRVTWICEVRR